MAADSSQALVEGASALVLRIGSLDASNCPHRRESIAARHMIGRRRSMWDGSGVGLANQ